MTTAEAAEEFDDDNNRDEDDEGDGSDVEEGHNDEMTSLVVCAPITAVREFGASCKDGGEREV